MIEVNIIDYINMIKLYVLINDYDNIRFTDIQSNLNRFNLCLYITLTIDPNNNFTMYIFRNAQGFTSKFNIGKYIFH